MPYEMRQVAAFAYEAKRQLTNMKSGLRELERGRSRLGSDFGNDSRFKSAAASLRQQMLDLDRLLSRIEASVGEIERLAR